MKGVDISHYQKGLTIRQIRDAGVEVIEVDVVEWQQACSGVYDKYGAQFADIIAEIKATKYE